MKRAQQGLGAAFVVSAIMLIVVALFLGYLSVQLGILGNDRATGSFLVNGHPVRYDVGVNETFSGSSWTARRTSTIDRAEGLIESRTKLSSGGARWEIENAIGACVDIDVSKHKEVVFDFSVEAVGGYDRGRHTQIVQWPIGDVSCETDESSCSTEVVRPVLKYEYEEALGKYSVSDNLGHTDLVVAPSVVCFNASTGSENSGASVARTMIQVHDVATVPFADDDETPDDFDCLAVGVCDENSPEGNDAGDEEERGFWGRVGAWFVGLWETIKGWFT